MICAEKLSKFYGGKRALGPVSFTIEEGETVGFLGLNGAGKTTALRILACDLRPSSGTVSIGEVDALANPHEVRKRIGFLPESPPLYQDMTVSDYLHFAGQLRGMSSAAARTRLPKVLDITHLEDVADDAISQLSHGYRQRVGVAQAIIHNPTLLILDEPTRGLDPVQIVEMRNMVHDLKKNHTVLISSHILTEISQTCDRLLVLGKGAILAAGTEKELTKDIVDIKTITTVVRPGSGKSADEVASCLEKIAGVEAVKGVDIDQSPQAQQAQAREYRIACSRDVRAEVSRAVVSEGHDLLKLDHGHSELERTFLKLVQGGPDALN